MAFRNAGLHLEEETVNEGGGLNDPAAVVDEIGEVNKDFAIDEEVDQPEPPAQDNEPELLNQGVVDNEYPRDGEINDAAEYEEAPVDTLAGNEEYEQLDDPIEPGEYVEGVEYGPLDDDQGYILEDEVGEDPRDYEGNYEEVGPNQAREYRPRPESLHDDGIGIADDGIIDEAFEDDGTIDRMIKKKQRRNKYKLSQAEVRERAHDLVNQLEYAAEKDLQLHSDGEVAMEKLKLIPRLEQTLMRREFQQCLLEEGILGVLKAWIEPLSDGTLPNIKVRSTVLKCLKQLPIDTRDQESRDFLKSSDIGSRVMFLSKISAETRENRKLARDLCQQWARPIFEEARDESKEAEMIRETLAARKRRLDMEKVEEEKAKFKKLKPGEPGYRHTATIPAPSRLDYVIKPDSRINPDEARSKGKRKSSVMIKLGRMQRNKTIMQGRSLQAARPSVEGRGM